MVQRLKRGRKAIVGGPGVAIDLRVQHVVAVQSHIAVAVAEKLLYGALFVRIYDRRYHKEVIGTLNSLGDFGDRCVGRLSNTDVRQNAEHWTLDLQHSVADARGAPG